MLLDLTIGFSLFIFIIIISGYYNNPTKPISTKKLPNTNYVLIINNHTNDSEIYQQLNTLNIQIDYYSQSNGLKEYYVSTNDELIDKIKLLPFVLNIRPSLIFHSR